MAGSNSGETRELSETPTWAVALICAVMIVISLLLDKGLHHIGEWFHKKNKNALVEALEKVKNELMILGFISLLLVFFQNYIAEICIPESAGNTMLPCRRGANVTRRLLWADTKDFSSNRRSLANTTPANCTDVSFFRQFIRSVRKTDYLILRHGFINAHLNARMKFNFQKYIKRTLEDDFKVMVGIRYVILLVIVMILAVGTKLQAIIASMALEIQQSHAVIQGMPLVKLSDHHFWFGRPHLVLSLIHFTLFVNAFQLANFLWIWYLFGLRSCFHETFAYVVARICIGVAVHLLCSYITLPLYALVSQMGSHIKMSIFDEQTSKALKKWRDAARKRNKKGSSHSPSVTPSPSPGQSPIASPASRHLHRYRTMGYAGEGIRRSHSDNEISDVDIEMSITRSELNRKNSPQEMRLNVEERRDEDDFSFVKLGSRRGQSK
ncbi:MLO-like protein 8 [Carex littledalei]|uniref:MLO-like protein n=1 Tax=Carex littledalei TaxID=544730 RepID=A0A833RE63_9POAL|nr:MLO-like protein 8 [Carex littledalei]